MKDCRRRRRRRTYVGPALPLSLSLPSSSFPDQTMQQRVPCVPVREGGRQIDVTQSWRTDDYAIELAAYSR